MTLCQMIVNDLKKVIAFILFFAIVPIYYVSNLCFSSVEEMDDIQEQLDLVVVVMLSLVPGIFMAPSMYFFNEALKDASKKYPIYENDPQEIKEKHSRKKANYVLVFAIMFFILQMISFALIQVIGISIRFKFTNSYYPNIITTLIGTPIFLAIVGIVCLIITYIKILRNRRKKFTDGIEHVEFSSVSSSIV